MEECVFVKTKMEKGGVIYTSAAIGSSLNIELAERNAIRNLLSKIR